MNAPSLLPVLLELLIKGTMLLAAAALFHRLARRTSAARLHLIWATAFAALLLLPLTKLATPRWPVSFRPAAAPRVISGPVAIADQLIAGEPAPIPPKSSKAPAFRMPDVTALAVGFWVVGAGILLALRALGSLQLWIMKRRSTLIEDSRLLEMSGQVAMEFGISRRVELRTTNEGPGPLTWGTWHPVLMFPSGYIHWSDDQILAALRHEYGHIARNDYLTRSLAHVATALYWPNPFVWLAGRCLRTLQEQACDDLVLRGGTPARDYAILLIDATRSLSRRSWAVQFAAAMVRRSTLEHRVVAIVDPDRKRQSASRTALLSALPVAAVVLTGSALAQLGEPKPTAPQPIPGLEPAGGEGLRSSVASITNKANRTIIPKVEFRGATLRECLDYLYQNSRELDPEKTGINIVLKASPQEFRTSPAITMSLRNISYFEAVQKVAGQAGLKLRVDRSAIALVPLSDPDPLIQKEYRLSPDFALGVGRDRALTAVLRVDVTDFIKSKGVTFPTGASAVYVAQSERLIMKNNQENLDRFDAIVNDFVMKQAPGTKATLAPDQQGLNAKLNQIVIPSLQLREATPSEAIAFLQKKSIELDPEKVGVSLLLNIPKDYPDTRITISLKDIPLIETLKYITNLSGLQYRVTESAVIIIPVGSNEPILKEYALPPALVSADGRIVGPDGNSYPGAMELLRAFDITFPEGTTAAFTQGGKVLSTRNSQENLDKTDVIAAALKDAKGQKLPAKELDLMTRTLQNR